jgi:hypothetical protein
MTVRIPIKPKEITYRDLVDIYRIFCDVYEKEPNSHDENRLIRNGIEELSQPMGIHLRHGPYTKFFAQKIGDGIEFKVRFDAEKKEQTEKKEEFAERVKKYFQETHEL